MLADYESGSPREAIQHSPKSLKQAPRAAEERSHGSPANAPLLPPKFKNILGFAPLRCPKIPRKHRTTPKKSLFLPLFSLFCAVLPLLEVLPIVQLPRWVQVLPVCPDAVRQSRTGAHKERGNATRKRAGASEERKKGSDNPTSPQKGVPPPYCKGQAALPLITNSRQKISKKSLG